MERHITKEETRYCFDFAKAIGIISIYSFHFYGRYIGDSTLMKLIDHGILNNLLLNIKTFEQAVCFVFQVIFAYGNIGVHLFIIASGFGLCYSHLSKHMGWGIFFKKRFIRIMPLYYFFLFLVFFLAVFASDQKFYSSPEGLKVLVYHVFLLQTLNESYVYYGFFYFIAIIFQLYLLFPLLSKALRKEILRLPVFILSLFASVAIKGIFVIVNVQFSGVLITDYIPIFYLGMLLADSVHNRRKLHRFLFDERLSLVCVFLLPVLIYFLLYNFYDGRGVRFIIAVITFLSLPLVFKVIRKLKFEYLISFIAYCAYPFYLSHMIFINRIVFFFTKRGSMTSVESWVLIGFLTMPLAFGSAYLVQKGYDRISGRFLKP